MEKLSVDIFRYSVVKEKKNLGLLGRIARLFGFETTVVKIKASFYDPAEILLHGDLVMGQSKYVWKCLQDEPFKLYLYIECSEWNYDEVISDLTEDLFLIGNSYHDTRR